jgi:hypothetical protein
MVVVELLLVGRLFGHALNLDFFHLQEAISVLFKFSSVVVDHFVDALDRFGGELLLLCSLSGHLEGARGSDAVLHQDAHGYLAILALLDFLLLLLFDQALSFCTIVVVLFDHTNCEFFLFFVACRLFGDVPDGR